MSIATNHVVRRIAIAIGTDRQAVTSSCILSFKFSSECYDDKSKSQGTADNLGDIIDNPYLDVTW